MCLQNVGFWGWFFCVFCKLFCCGQYLENVYKEPQEEIRDRTGCKVQESSLLPFLCCSSSIPAKIMGHCQAGLLQQWWTKWWVNCCLEADTSFGMGLFGFIGFFATAALLGLAPGDLGSCSWGKAEPSRNGKVIMPSARADSSQMAQGNSLALWNLY